MSRRRRQSSNGRHHRPSTHAVVCRCGLGLAYSGTFGFYCLRCDETLDHAN